MAQRGTLKPQTDAGWRWDEMAVWQDATPIFCEAHTVRAELFLCFVSGADQRIPQLCQTLACTRHLIVQLCGNFNDLSLLLKSFLSCSATHLGSAADLETGQPCTRRKRHATQFGSESCSAFDFSTCLDVPSSCRPLLHQAASRCFSRSLAKHAFQVPIELPARRSRRPSELVRP